MDISNILARFGQVTEEQDGGYLAACPAHDDSRPSLRVWRGDDNKVRITCRAGCTTEDVVAAVSLTWPDLFNVTGAGPLVPREAPQLVGVAQTAALAVYVDVTSAAYTRIGEHSGTDASTYAAARFGLDIETACELALGQDFAGLGTSLPYLSRQFRQFPRLTVPLRDFNGVVRGLQGRDLSGQCPGRWLSLTNPPGMRWSPYGVLKGSGGYSPVLVTEGPSDGLTAVAVGYDVVFVRGASLVNNPDLIRELAEGLRGRQVIVCGDSDKAGNAFTARLVEGLTAHNIPVYALTIPRTGDDLTDWRARDAAAFPAALHDAVKRAVPAKSATEVEQSQRAGVVAERTGTVTVSDDQGREAARVLADVVRAYGDSDAMNAYALVAWTEGRIRYAEGLGFFVWDGSTWNKSATRVRQEIHRMGAALILAGNVKEARPFTMTSRIEALMTELRSVPSVHVDAAEFDARPELLSFRNGTVDLRTGRLRPHDPDDMLTMSLPVDYEPNAKCPRWELFLSEVFPAAPELPGYLQRMTGYGITGETSEQCFAVLWGKGANGKSVFTDTTTTVFAGITRTTPFATFEDKTSGGIPNDIAALRGARLVMASEGENDRPMSEAVLKRVTGKDKVTARFLNKEFFTFAPTFLIMLATNHKPKFRGQDEGLWRRVKLIPFTRYFAPAERDYDLDKKLLAESAGIVAWAVRGAVEWYRGGLQDPEIITTATREYRETSDALAGFMPGVLALDASAVMPGSEAFNTYLEWCEAENLPQKERWTRRTFFAAMEERDGVTRRKTNKGIALVGIRHADAPTVPAVNNGPGIFSE